MQRSFVAAVPVPRASDAVGAALRRAFSPARDADDRMAALLNRLDVLH